jgi:hypothetical protein
MKQSISARSPRFRALRSFSAVNFASTRVTGAARIARRLSGPRWRCAVGAPAAQVAQP